MAKKKKDRKSKKTADIKRILLLIFGSTAVLSMLFIAGYLIDYAAVKYSTPPPTDRFSIIEKSKKNEKAVKNDPKKVLSKKDDYSFFETLLKQDLKKDKHDIKREDELRTHSIQNQKKEPKEQAESETGTIGESTAVYAVQLGSFKVFGTARSFRDKYMAKGYKAYIVSADLPGKGTLYRVRTGRFKKIEDAQNFSANFEKKEKVNTFITSK